MRESKKMQINIEIYPEDEGKDALRKFLFKILDMAYENTMVVESITLERKQLFGKNDGFAI